MEKTVDEHLDVITNFYHWVQESREKSFILRENIEKYEERYDDMQGMYLEFLLEDGKVPRLPLSKIFSL